MKIERDRFLVADCETNGLLDQLDQVNLLTFGAQDEDTVHVFRPGVFSGSLFSPCDGDIEEGLSQLMTLVNEIGYTLCFHNAIRFDIPAIQKVYPWFVLEEDRVFDSLVFLKLKFPDLYNQLDAPLVRKGKLPKDWKGYKSHKLEHWGMRVGEYKGEYEGDTTIADEKDRKVHKWDEWNPDLEHYGIQDVVTLRAVLEKTKPWAYSQRAIELEHAVYRIIQRQISRGQWFDEAKAQAFYLDLKEEQQQLLAELRSLHKGWYFPKGQPVEAKRDNKTLGYIKGTYRQVLERREFSPTSRQHIAKYFREVHGWKPMVFTETGEAQIDEGILSELPYPEASKFQQLFTVEKMLGMLGDGNKAWLKLVKNGLIHGRVESNGAVTGRMTHNSPNLAQVPRVGTLYGYRCRDLFGARPGYVRIGVDASGLELRCLGHYLAKFDGGKYARAVVEGVKEDETDAHSLTCIAIGFKPKETYEINKRPVLGRDIGKTSIYAFVFGASPPKLGSIIGKGKEAGLKMKNAFLTKIPGLRRLMNGVQKIAKERGYLIGLDGRRIPVRSTHAALNTLLQGAGACVMKMALVILDRSLQDAGYTPGVDYEFVANVHDEFQLEVKPEIVDHALTLATSSIRSAGESLGFRCPLDGDAAAGATWAHTH